MSLAIFDEDTDDLSKEFKDCCMYYMNFAYPGVRNDPVEFLCHASCILDPKLCAIIEQETRNQRNDKFWYEIKYGRITSRMLWAARGPRFDERIYNTVMKRSPDGNFSEPFHLLRKEKLLPTLALELVEKQIGKKFHKCGLILNGEYPVFAAIPDYIGDDFILDIEYPRDEIIYTDLYNHGELVYRRHKYRLMLEMLMCEKNTGYFCIVHPNFNVNNQIICIKFHHYYMVALNRLMSGAVGFWEKHIFPFLIHPETNSLNIKK